MENTNVTTITTRAKIDPSLMIHRGGTTFLIGINFAEKGDTLEDKVKRMIRKEIQNNDSLLNPVVHANCNKPHQTEPN